jgi:hypothetical protein
MKSYLSPAQLDFARRSLNEDTARDIYFDAARRFIADQTGCYLDKLDWRENRDSWTFPFGIWIAAKDATPAAVVTDFNHLLKVTGFKPGDIPVLMNSRSLFGHYNLRICDTTPARFTCFSKYFERNLFWMLMFIQGIEMGTDYKVVNDWTDANRHVLLGYAWSVDCHNIAVKKFKNGRIDLGLTREQLRTIKEIYAMWEMDRKLSQAAAQECRRLNDKEAEDRMKSHQRFLERDRTSGGL